MPRAPKENIVSSPTVELLAQPTKELKKTQEDIETEEDIKILCSGFKEFFPAEFFPKNSFARPDQRKVTPKPFYRYNNSKLTIAFNLARKRYDIMSLDEVALMVEKVFHIPNTNTAPYKTLSRAKRAIIQMKLEEPQVALCNLIAGYQGGVYETRGRELVVVPYTERIAEAADVKAETLSEGKIPFFDKWRPLWDEVFNPLLVSPTGDETQYKIFCQYVAGCREVIGRGYNAKIPALVIVGAAGAGKTLLSKIVIESLTGRKDNPGKYLFNEEPYTDALIGSPVLVVDDNTPIRGNITASRLKELIVGDGLKYREMYGQKQPTVYPVNATLILTNADRFARKSVPVIDASTKDKIILFKAYEGGIPSDERTKRWNRLMDALPYFLAFLDRYVAPDLDHTQRMIVPAWQNPEIMEMIFDDTTDGDLHAIIQTLLAEKPGLDGQSLTANEWLKELENCELTQRDIHDLYLSPRQLGRRIADLAERSPNLYARTRKADRMRTRIITIRLEPPEPTQLPDVSGR